jgi:hypothetical protein
MVEKSLSTRKKQRGPRRERSTLAGISSSSSSSSSRQVHCHGHCACAARIAALHVASTVATECMWLLLCLFQTASSLVIIIKKKKKKKSEQFILASIEKAAVAWCRRHTRRLFFENDAGRIRRMGVGRRCQECKRQAYIAKKESLIPFGTHQSVGWCRVPKCRAFF